MQAERSLKIIIAGTLALVVLQGGLTCLIMKYSDAPAGAGLDLQRFTLVLIAAACTLSGWFLAWHSMARRKGRGSETEGGHASLLLQSVEEGVVSVDGTGCVTFANLAAHELLGYQPGELEGRDLREVMHHGNRPDCASCDRQSCLLHPAFGGGSRQRTRNELLWRKDGSSFSADFSCSSLAGGTLPGSVLTFRDVSARREAEKRLRLQGAALEAAATGIMIADRERIVWVNQALCRLLGVLPEQVLGQKPRALLVQGGNPELLASLAGSLEAGTPWQGELASRRSDGSALDQEVTVTPVLDEQGSVSNFIWIMLDISRRKQSEKALMESTRAQEEANRQLVRTVQRANELAVKASRASAAKSEFLANMSHEIRTPMNAIVGAGHLLRGTELSPRQTDYLQTLTISADLLLGIINDVLDFSKIEAGKLGIDRVEFSLQDVVAELLAVYSVRAGQQGLSLQVELDHAIPELLAGDPMRLSQILNNLLSNALKFTRHGQIRLEVKLARSDDASAELIFSVRDTGIGIMAQDQAQLFQPFTQLDSSLTRSVGGAGLGLAICRHLATMMKGEIWCESVAGLGSTFSFWLPFGKVSGAKSGERKREMGGAPFNQQQVLLVEDNPFNQKVARSILERGGLQVTLASNGVEAVDLVKQREFDLVLMDIRMPVMDGLTAARRIRDLGRPATDALPILAVSANAMEQDVAASLAAGMNGHVAKPFTPESLYRAIAVWLKETQANSQAVAPPARHEARIDFETGLRQTGGDSTLYRDLLRQFEHEYHDQGDDIEREVQAGNLEEAGRLVHSVKGIAGVLAAQPLHRAAQRLESALKEGGDLTQVLSDFQQELEGTIRCLRAGGWQHLSSSAPRTGSEDDAEAAFG